VERKLVVRTVFDTLFFLSIYTTNQIEVLTNRQESSGSRVPTIYSTESKIKETDAK
jgi:hypothetical protein